MRRPVGGRGGGRPPAAWQPASLGRGGLAAGVGQTHPRPGTVRGGVRVQWERERVREREERERERGVIEREKEREGDF